MGRLAEALERRDHPRLRRQLACALLVDGRCHRGIVRDLSARGLYVQTGAELPRGAEAVVAFRTPEGRRIVLEATLPQRRRLPLSLASLASGGVVLRIQDPPPAYLRWVEGVSAEEA